MNELPKKRPERTYKTGIVTRALRLGSLALTGCLVVTLLVKFPSMPQELPSQITDQLNGIQSNSKSLVLWFILFMVLIQGIFGWISTKPKLVKYPTEINEANAQQLYREGERLMVWFSCMLALLFAGISLTFLGLPDLFLTLLAGPGIVVAVLVGMARMKKVAISVAS